MNTDLFEAIHANPWADAEGLVDLPALNADVSAAIEECVVRQRDVARSEPRALRSHSFVVIGPAGAGKTHLFARLRKRLGPKAVFVHIRPLLNSEMTARFVLGEIAKQLAFTTMGSRQVDALVGSLLAHLEGAASTFPRTFLEEFTRLGEHERARRLEEVIERVFALWQDLDEVYLQRLVSVPFGASASQRAALAWLSGRECDETQLARIGASSSMDESAVVPALRTISSVAALGAPIVLVFDQLENLVDGGDGRSRLLAYGNLASELVDSARGLVLVHMAIDTEWKAAIEPALGASQRSRIAMRTKLLALPTPAERDELLRLWAASVPDAAAPFPWPFGERRVARLRAALGMTPRMMLVECRAALESGAEDDPAPARDTAGAPLGATKPQDGAESIEEALAAEWGRQLDEARRVLDEAAATGQCVDPARLADGLAVASTFAPPLTVDVRLHEPAQLTWKAASGVVRMALLHHTSPRSLGATLAKLAALADKGPLLAVRERVHELRPTWKDTLAKRASLLGKGHAHWVALERDDASRLLALASMTSSARSGDVTDLGGRKVAVEAVRAWVVQALDVPSWPIMRAVLSPGDAPMNDADDGRPMPGPARAGVTLSVLVRLRVASVDRLVREVARIDRQSTRASVLHELEQAREKVRWFGTALVCAREEA
jgi:hypothetical protein